MFDFSRCRETPNLSSQNKSDSFFEPVNQVFNFLICSFNNAIEQIRLEHQSERNNEKTRVKMQKQLIMKIQEPMVQVQDAYVQVMNIH